MCYASRGGRLPTSTYALTSFRVTYKDGHGVLRDVLAATTDLGYVVSNLEVEHLDDRALVAVTMDAEEDGTPRIL